MSDGNIGTATSTNSKGEPKKQMHWSAYFLYYIVAFFAFWFGAKRFDQDGDGDFDPEDVRFWLEEHGVRGKQCQQTAKERQAAKKRAAIRERILAEKEAERKKKAEEAAANGEDASVFDRDGDGDVDLEDLINSKVSGKAQETEAMHDLMTGKTLPIFMMCECGFILAVWFIMAIFQSSKHGTDFLVTQGGLDSLVEGMFDLRLAGTMCEDYRSQIWRWLSYQFTHIGASHVGMNIFLNLMLGIPLESIHGSWRLALMFNVGVFGGACNYMVTDAHTPVVGCSGGCYALIGIHIADTIMNWSQKKYRLPTVFMIFVLVAVDFLTYYLAADDGSKSHAAHVGGAIAGLIIGVLVCKNMKVHSHEKVIAAVLAILGGVLVAFSLGWMGAQHDGPLNIFEAAAGENGWCWIRQVGNTEYDPNSWVCVRCGIRACINRWSTEQNIKAVSLAVCNERGFFYDGR